MNSKVHHIISEIILNFHLREEKFWRAPRKDGSHVTWSFGTRRGRRLVGNRGRHLRQKHVVPGLSGLHDPCGALRSILRHPGPSATRTDRCAILRIVRDEGGDTASLPLPWLFTVETWNFAHVQEEIHSFVSMYQTLS